MQGTINKAEITTLANSDLPSHIEDTFREAYASAWNNHQSASSRGDADITASTQGKEVLCHKLAWSAVGKQYIQDEN